MIISSGDCESTTAMTLYALYETQMLLGVVKVSVDVHILKCAI